MFAFLGIQRFFCVRLIRSYLVLTDLSTVATLGLLVLVLSMFQPTNDGHFHLAQLFHLTIVNETKTVTSFSHLRITSLA
jgi:hypothetical protein